MGLFKERVDHCFFLQLPSLAGWVVVGGLGGYCLGGWVLVFLHPSFEVSGMVAVVTGWKGWLTVEVVEGPPVFLQPVLPVVAVVAIG